MATKNDTAAKLTERFSEFAQGQWSAADDNQRAHRQAAAQFHAIGEQLGWRGPASDLAKTGQQLADLSAQVCSDQCNEIRDVCEDMKRGAKGVRHG
jgi:hypothetical protein